MKGSTPAHAGNTGAGYQDSGEITVYPRPRGEYCIGCDKSVGAVGLPPPTRGIPPQLRHSGLSARSTPAHAGNTVLNG